MTHSEADPTADSRLKRTQRWSLGLEHIITETNCPKLISEIGYVECHTVIRAGRYHLEWHFF